MAACPYNDLTEQNNNDEEEDKDNKDKEEEEEDNVPIMTSQQNNSTEIPQTFLLCKETLPEAQRTQGIESILLTL